MPASKQEVSVFFRAYDRFTGPLQRMEKSLTMFRRATRSVESFNNGLDRTTRTARTMGTVGAVGLFAMSVAMRDLVVTGAEFEHQLISAAAKFPGMVKQGTETFDRLGDVARRMGRETEFTATQSAEGLNFLAMAGFDAEQAIAALPGTMNLATIAGMDLGFATDVATDALGSFNLITQDSVKLQENLTRVNDVLAKTITTSNTTVEQFFEAMKQSGAAATNAGGDIETYASAVGMLSSSGVKASQAGTTLKRMFLQLVAPTGAAAATLKALGVETTHMVNGKNDMRDIIDIFADLEKALEPLGSADRQEALRNIFGLIPIAGVNIMLSRGADAWRAYREELRKSQGASAEMAELMRSSVLNRFRMFISALRGIQIALFDLEAGAMDAFLKKMTEMTRGIILIIEANEELSRGLLRETGLAIWDAVKAFGAFIAVVVILKTALLALQVVITLGAVVMYAWKAAAYVAAGAAWLLNTSIGATLFAAFYALTSMILSFVIPAFTTLWAIMVANPIGAIVVAVAALVAAGIWLYNNWNVVKQKLGDAWDWMGQKWDDFISLFTDNMLAKSIGTMMDSLGSLWDRISKITEGITLLGEKTPQAVKIVQSVERRTEDSMVRGLPKWFSGSDERIREEDAAFKRSLGASGSSVAPVEGGRGGLEIVRQEDVMRNLTGQIMVSAKEGSTADIVDDGDGILKSNVKTERSGS